MDHNRIKLLLEQRATLPDVDYLESATVDHVDQTLRLHEKLTSQLREIQATVALEKYELSLIEDPLKRALQENIHAAKNMLVQRQCTDIEGALRQIEEWLSAVVDQENNTAN